MVTGSMLLALAGGVGVAVAVVLAVVSRRSSHPRSADPHLQATDPEAAAALRDIQAQIDRGRGPLG
ncbi:hypothetical protein ITJ57_05655 [Plantibacter sp. VKM Ac-2880]|uniref:hypothetical protein n=1 Tax=Plantibacter sp. VKM Ac-2880 TaxID=2783827 RepID=UPI00188E907F|nr:hypothetical protein [Plantibacter sp. VKM Ac-2880]MBF4568250.1 hypothetical protein [Plantibacter sp. VKM Ac-2880]